MSGTEQDLAVLLARINPSRVELVLEQDRDKIHSMTDEGVLRTLAQADIDNKRCSEAAEALYRSASRAADVMLLATTEASRRGLTIR